MKTLINMELSAEEAKELTQPDPGEAPKYPWGLELRLEDDQLTKLGITALPEVGTSMMVTGRVEVISSSISDTQSGGKCRCLTLQVTDMALSADTNATPASTQLYGGSSSTGATPGAE